MLLATLLSLSLQAGAPAPEPVVLPEGGAGIGFDDMTFAPKLGRVVVPAGRTGRLDLVDPATRKVESIAGFAEGTKYAGGHGEGTTSADEGQALLFASDRSRKLLLAVDPKSKKVVAQAALADGPDYVRYVAPTHEVWVTEPHAKAIEIFQLEAGPALKKAGALTLPDGPESLVVDAARGRAYSHSWKDTTFAIDLKKRAVVAHWSNGCQGARGIALDEARGLLFAGCDEGRAVTMDLGHDGAQVGHAEAGQGVDIIAFAPGLAHLYVPGGDAATLTVLGVSAQGALSVLGTLPAAKDAHCVAADSQGGIYLCDPGAGRLLYYRDPYPASR